MKIWEHFKQFLITNAVNGNLFYTFKTLPQTDIEKYWYNRGLQDSLMDLKTFEEQCERTHSIKYDSLVKCLSQHNILVHYDEATNISHISVPKELHLKEH